MSQENVEIVRRVYDSWNRDDWQAGERLFHADIEWRTAGLFPGFKPVYHGIDGIREFWDTMKDAGERSTVGIDRLLESGDIVVVEGNFQAEGKGSGLPVELQVAHVWQLADSLVVSYAAYPSSAEALEAGLSA